MGYQNEGTTRLVMNLETAPIVDAADYLEAPEAPSNYKHQDAIERYLVDAKAKALDKAGLDPDLARIVALGWMLEGRDSAPRVLLCEGEDQERYALQEFWRDVRLDGGAVRRLVTFNGHAFDLPVLMRRSLYLEIDAPWLNIDKYRSPHVDLMLRLNYHGVLKMHSLSFYGRRFGLSELRPDLDGAQIAGFVRAGEWASVEAHCRSQVALTYDLAARLRYVEFDEDVHDEAQKARGMVA